MACVFDATRRQYVDRSPHAESRAGQASALQSRYVFCGFGGLDLRQIPVFVDGNVGRVLQFIPVRGAESNGRTYVFYPGQQFFWIEWKLLQSGLVHPGLDRVVEGLKAGKAIAKSNPIAKVVIVVDKDINILDPVEMLMAVGSRWQPYPAAEIIEEAFGLMTDPSQVEYQKTSKIVIDATIQLPGEGGQDVFPLRNRALLEQGEPDIWSLVDTKFGTQLKSWKEV